MPRLAVAIVVFEVVDPLARVVEFSLNDGSFLFAKVAVGTKVGFQFCNAALLAT